MISCVIYFCSSEMDTSTHVKSVVAASDHQGGTNPVCCCIQR